MCRCYLTEALHLALHSAERFFPLNAGQFSHCPDFIAANARHRRDFSPAAEHPFKKTRNFWQVSLGHSLPILGVSVRGPNLAKPALITQGMARIKTPSEIVNGSPEAARQWQRDRDIEHRVNQIWALVKVHRHSLDSEMVTAKIRQMVDDFLPCHKAELETLSRKHKGALSQSRGWRRKYMALLRGQEEAA